MNMNDDTPARDETGRFLPGNPGGPGRPKQTTETEYHDASMRGCTPSDWERIVRRAVADTEDRKPATRNAARAFLLRVLFGQAPGALVQIANLGPADAALPALGRYALENHPAHAAAVLEVLTAYRREVEAIAARELPARPGGLSEAALAAIEGVLIRGGADPTGDDREPQG
jgi:hypothetical protein